jgi:hypothetical protein
LGKIYSFLLWLVAFLVVILPSVPFAMGFYIAILDPSFIWMEHGYFPDRDLLFWFSDVSCKLTDWKDEGFTGMDICRKNEVFFTDWIGLNKILNLLAEVNLFIYAVLFSLAILVLTAILSVIVENLESMK